MRIAAATCSATLVLLATTAPAGATARHTLTGTLSGVTKIDDGCPAVSSGNTCNPWRLFPHAKFTVTRLTARGALPTRTPRIVESDGAAKFGVVLRPGSYVVDPVAGPNARGGSPVVVRVTVGATTTTSVRYTAIHRQA